MLTGGEDKGGGLQPGQCFLLDEEAGATGHRRTLGCACGQGALALDVIQLPGKRALATTEILRGHADLATALLGT